MTDVLASYRAAGPGHDEMLQSTGAARAAWAQMADLARISDGEQLLQRTQDVTALIQDHGVTLGRGDDQHPWPLDPLPVLFDEHEWAHVEAGLQQRAVLLDHVLTDLYGGARLLADGYLPPALVLGHEGFVRAVADIRNPGSHQLFMLGVDLARNADGSWQVLADVGQAPSGMGFAMQDRRIVAEVLSGLYRHARIRRLGPFFQAVRRAVREAAPAHAGANPRAVLLAPGEDSSIAFDHAYLANLLGYPLVEGSDLVVQEGRVWMRSLDRLEPVDVVLRHVDALLCDPLDLRGSSRLGVPGLVEAARGGGVTIANPLGSGALDNPGLLTYLPRLARVVLGEELLIRSTVTYWCGERSMCSHVIANLDRLVVRSTNPGSVPVRGWELSIAERADLSVRIATEPHLWVGQEPVEASTTPTVEHGTLQARATQLRTFAVTSGEGYEVMSGGLARSSAVGRDIVVLEEDSTAKDVWVLSSHPHSAADAGSEESAPVPLRLPTSVSPSAAEDLFWFGRYSERAEAVARTARAVNDRWNDFADLAERIRTVAQGQDAPSHGAQGQDAPSHDGQGAPSHDEQGAPSHDEQAPVAVAHDGVAALAVVTDALVELYGTGTFSSLVLDPASPTSVAHAAARMARAAGAVRDQLSTDTLAAISSIERALTVERLRQVRDGTLGTDTDVVAVTGRVVESATAIAGIVAESMERDVGWCLLEAGRRLERSQQLLALLAVTVTQRQDPGVESLVLETVLLAQESAITYRRRYQARVGVATVLDLLLLDERNPRSLRFQLNALAAALADVPAGARPILTRQALLAQVLELLEEVDTRAVAVADEEGRRGELSELLHSMRWRLRELGEEIARVHFTRTAPTPWIDASGTFATAVVPPEAGPVGEGGEPIWSEPGRGRGES